MRKISFLFVCIMALVALLAWTPPANAFPGLYAAECAGCHGGAVSGFSPATGTCAGCHAHGTHSGTGTGDINISATPDKLVYAPGETVAVTINGGSGHNGYIRAKLFDQDCSVITCDTSVTGPHVIDDANNPCPNGDCPVGFGAAGPAGTTTQYPVTILTGIAPSTPGTVTWSASWYGHLSDGGDAGFANWVPSSSNPTHGDEIVTFSFEVVAANTAPTADPKGPYTAEVDVSVMFDGTGSEDPDGTIVSYDWDFGDGSTGSGVNPSHTYTSVGIFDVNLTVTDDKGATDTATAIADITAAAASECEGNFNGDGNVDDSDLSVFSVNFGRTDCGVPTTCSGDFNNDGDVDGSDLAVFAADFGRIDCP